MKNQKLSKRRNEKAKNERKEEFRASLAIKNIKTCESSL